VKQKKREGILIPGADGESSISLWLKPATPTEEGCQKYVKDGQKVCNGDSLKHML
jgi:hypothetical protein